MKFSKETLKQIIQEEITNTIKEQFTPPSSEEAYAILKMALQQLDKGDMASARDSLEQIEIYFDNKLAGGETAGEFDLDNLDEQLSEECKRAAETLRNCMKGADKRPKSSAVELGVTKEPIVPEPGARMGGIKFVNEDEENEQ